MTPIEQLRSISDAAYELRLINHLKPVRDNGEFVASVPYTPVELIRELCSHIPQINNSNFDIRIAVLYTVEIALYLGRLGFTNITIITAEHDDRIKSITTKFDFEYVVSPIEEQIDMKFDCVVGNPPYEKQIYKKFMLKGMEMLVDGGDFAMITPSSYLAGNGSRRFRVELAKAGTICRMEHLPNNVFTTKTVDGANKQMILSTTVTYMRRTKLIDEYTFDNVRNINGMPFLWVDASTNIEGGLHLYYDNIGKSLWDVVSKYSRKFDVSATADYRNQSLEGPNVNIGVKTQQQYLGSSVRLSNLMGDKLWCGMVVDGDGNYEYIRKHAASSNNKRLLYKTQTALQAHNLGRWMSSKLFGVLLSMTGTSSDVTLTTVGQLPFIVLDGEYETNEEFNNAIYDELGLTEEHRSWIKQFGTKQ